MIKQVGDKWILFSKDGKRKLGIHDSIYKAKAQESAIKQSIRARGYTK